MYTTSLCGKSHWSNGALELSDRVEFVMHVGVDLQVRAANYGGFYPDQSELLGYYIKKFAFDVFRITLLTTSIYLEVGDLKYLLLPVICYNFVQFP